jgi:hypothetical protein
MKMTGRARMIRMIFSVSRIAYFIAQPDDRSSFIDYRGNSDILTALSEGFKGKLFSKKPFALMVNKKAGPVIFINQA